MTQITFSNELPNFYLEMEKFHFVYKTLIPLVSVIHANLSTSEGAADQDGSNTQQFSWRGQDAR